MKAMKAYISRLITTLRKASTKCARHMGLPLVYAGVALLAIFYFTGLNNHNLLLLLPLALMLFGVVGFVHNEKHKEIY